MARLESSGSLVHIMAHSIEGKNMFVDDDDRREFLSRFEKGLEKYHYQCYAWALMDTHYHLFLRTSDDPMSKLMRGLNGGYAQYYNKKRKKHGCLFQGRFKSVLCQDADYAVELVKYIHLNPLRAGMVNSLDQLKEWAWCGHGFLLGTKGANGERFQNRLETLRRFGDNEHDAVISYLKFLSQSCQSGNETAGQLPTTEATEIIGSCKGWPAVIGDPEYVQNVMERFKKNLNRRHRKADYGFVLKTKSKEICAKHDITHEELLNRGRNNKRSEARAAFCYRCHIKELIPLSVIAGYLRITISPVAVLVKKGFPVNKSVSCMQSG